jgi:hypothetical protein
MCNKCVFPKKLSDLRIADEEGNVYRVSYEIFNYAKAKHPLGSKAFVDSVGRELDLWKKQPLRNLNGRFKLAGHVIAR